jgi:hypothetical protein
VQPKWPLQALLSWSPWVGPSLESMSSTITFGASERRAILEKDDVQADPVTLPGKADTAG